MNMELGPITYFHLPVFVKNSPDSRILGLGSIRRNFRTGIITDL